MPAIDLIKDRDSSGTNILGGGFDFKDVMVNIETAKRVYVICSPFYEYRIRELTKDYTARMDRYTSDTDPGDTPENKLVTHIYFPVQ